MIVSVFEYSDYRLFLKECFATRKTNFKGLSHRYVAQKTQTSVGYFSKVCRGKTNVSLAKAALFADTFQLFGKEKEYFLAMVEENQSNNPSQKEESLQKMRTLGTDRLQILEEDQFEYYLEWYHSVIRELIGYVDNQSDYKSIAKELNPQISSKEVEESITLLKSLGLIKKNEMGRLIRVDRALQSKQPDVLSKALQEYVSIFTDLGKRAILDLPKEERFASSMVLSVSDSGENQIQEILQETQQKIVDVVLKDRNVDRVMDVNLHLFPLTLKGNS